MLFNRDEFCHIMTTVDIYKASIRKCHAVCSSAGTPSVLRLNGSVLFLVQWIASFYWRLQTSGGTIITSMGLRDSTKEICRKSFSISYIQWWERQTPLLTKKCVEGPPPTHTHTHTHTRRHHMTRIYERYTPMLHIKVFSSLEKVTCKYRIVMHLWAQNIFYQSWIFIVGPPNDVRSKIHSYDSIITEGDSMGGTHFPNSSVVIQCAYVYRAGHSPGLHFYYVRCS